MKSNETRAFSKRYLAFWTIPALATVFLGLLVLGIRFVDRYHEAGEYFTPDQPVAKEVARFHYTLKTPSGAPVQEGPLKLAVSKVKEANPLFFVSYLPQGPILKSQFYSFDGRLDLDALFWDEGYYLLSIETRLGEGLEDFPKVIPFRVKPPLSTYRNDLLLILGLLAAGFMSGYMGAHFKQARVSLAMMTVSMVLTAGLLLMPSALRADRDNGKVNSPISLLPQGPPQIMIRWEVNPVRPQAGESVTLTASVVDRISGEAVTEIDAALVVTHQEDHQDLLRIRNHLKEGSLVLNYTFPEGAEYLFSLHIAPTPRSSKLFFPVTAEKTLFIEPKEPAAMTQWRAFLFLTGLGWIGVAMGFITARHRAKRVMSGGAGQGSYEGQVSDLS